MKRILILFLLFVSMAGTVVAGEEKAWLGEIIEWEEEGETPEPVRRVLAFHSWALKSFGWRCDMLEWMRPFEDPTRTKVVAKLECKNLEWKKKGDGNPIKESNSTYYLRITDNPPKHTYCNAKGVCREF